MLMIAALAIGVTACSDDNEGDDPKGPATTNFNVRARGGNVLVTLATSDYAIDIPADAAAWVGQSEQSEGGVVVLTVEPNATGAERQTTVTLSAKTTLETLAYMKIKQSGESDVDSGDFVIEEIFYTSNTLPETGEPDMWYGDQYIKIRNNTDHDLYADGMLIIGSMLNSGQNFSFYEGEDFRPEYCATDDIYCIPGSGNDVLVKAGASLVICNNAQNHKANNPNSFDLTTADFEWFNESTNENYLDIDNPAVKNLDIWYTSTLTVFILHSRGYQCYAIAMPPAGMTKETFLKDYTLTGRYIYSWSNAAGSGSFDKTIKDTYKVPNAWVLDAVNTAIPSNYVASPWHSSLDAGYTYCLENPDDATAYGLSVRRKTGTDGKLVDTNNSTNDFTPRATPSLKTGK